MLDSLIAGSWVSGAADEVQDEDPARPDDVVATYRSVDAGQVDAACAAAVDVARSWARVPMQERAGVLLRASKVLEDRAASLARELTREEGKPLREAAAEVQRAAEVMAFYASESYRPTGSTYASARPSEQISTRQVPVGPTAIITPWNFPIAIPAWKIAPALVFGNPVVWKPSPVTPVLAVRLAECLVEAGLPDGVLNLVLGGGDVGAHLLQHRGVRACSFTGSTAVGRTIAAMGAERGVKVQAEMGGSNVAVVYADADLDLAASKIVAGAMGSTGQKCTATSRVVAQDAVVDELVDRIREGCASLEVGDPVAETTDLGPLATRAQLDSIRGLAEEVRETGGQVIMDGWLDPGVDDGYFVGPHVFFGLELEHRLWHEEVFGPVLSVVAASGEEMLDVANIGPFGLAASVFTSDLGRAMTAAEVLDVGVLHVNSETTGADTHVPFGGIGESGYGGRELGRAARAFYTETRTIYTAAVPH